jgi:hypothetical protein
LWQAGFGTHASKFPGDVRFRLPSPLKGERD